MKTKTRRRYIAQYNLDERNGTFIPNEDFYNGFSTDLVHDYDRAFKNGKKRGVNDAVASDTAIKICLEKLMGIFEASVSVPKFDAKKIWEKFSMTLSQRKVKPRIILRKKGVG